MVGTDGAVRIICMHRPRGDSRRLGARPRVAGLASRALRAAGAQGEGYPQTRGVP